MREIGSGRRGAAEPVANAVPFGTGRRLFDPDQMHALAVEFAQDRKQFVRRLLGPRRHAPVHDAGRHARTAPTGNIPPASAAPRRAPCSAVRSIAVGIRRSLAARRVVRGERARGARRVGVGRRAAARRRRPRCRSRVSTPGRSSTGRPREQSTIADSMPMRAGAAVEHQQRRRRTRRRRAPRVRRADAAEAVRARRGDAGHAGARGRRAAGRARPDAPGSAGRSSPGRRRRRRPRPGARGDDHRQRPGPEGVDQALGDRRQRRRRSARRRRGRRRGRSADGRPAGP